MDSIRSFIDSLAKAGFFPGHSVEDASPRKAIVNNDHEESNVRLKSHLERLPPEVLNNILTQGLSLRDTQNLAAASRSMHNLIHGVKINQDVFYSKVSTDDILRARNVDRLLVNKKQVNDELLMGAVNRARLDVLGKAKALGVTREDIMHTEDLFQVALFNGDLRVIKYLHMTFGLTREDAAEKDNKALRVACEDGHIDVVKYLHTGFGLTAEDARSGYNEVLRYACENGIFDVVEYLQRGFGLTAEDARTLDNDALRGACRNGHLGVVRYLHTGYGLTAEDARAMDNDALVMCAYKNELGIMKCLREVYGLNANDARTNNNTILIKACENGFLEVVKYLYTWFGLNANDARTNNNTILIKACENRFLDVVKYLHTGYGLTAEDARANNNSILNTCAYKNELGIMKCLREVYGLDANDARTILAMVCRKHENLEMARYLRDGFGLTEEDFAINKECRKVWNDISPHPRNYWDDLKRIDMI